MHTISVLRPIAASAGRVWTILRDFNGLPGWHPNVTASRLDGPQAIGCIRSLRLKNGATLRERLESVDDGARRTAYALLDGPLPVADYLGNLWVREHGGGCVVEWTSTMTITAPDPAPVAEALKAVYADGLAGLDALISGRPA